MVKVNGKVLQVKRDMDHIMVADLHHHMTIGLNAVCKVPVRILV